LRITEDEQASLEVGELEKGSPATSQHVRTVYKKDMLTIFARSNGSREYTSVPALDVPTFSNQVCRIGFTLGHHFYCHCLADKSIENAKERILAKKN